MARTRSSKTLSIPQIQQMLEARRSELAQLNTEKRDLERRLSMVTRQIRSLSDGRVGRRGAAGPVRRGTGPVRRRRRRAVNKVSLADTVEQVLSQSGKPLPVGEIASRVEATGYKTNSRNFRTIVNQALIKDERFTAADRGLYQLRK